MFHAGNPAYTEDRFQRLKDKLEYYCEELKRPHVTKDLLWKEYRQEQHDGYGHSQFQFHLLQHLRAKNPSMVLEHKPADKLFIDFAGKTTSYIDPDTGEIIRCQLFVACLTALNNQAKITISVWVNSDYQYNENYKTFFAHWLSTSVGSGPIG